MRNTNGSNHRKFVDTLRQIIGLSRECASGGEAAAGDRNRDTAERLKSALEGVLPELSLKLWALALAGNNGEGIGTASAAVAGAGPQSPLATIPPIVLGDYLNRGRAIAIATKFDLESPFVSWPSSSAETLDERAWLSFARQLAQSEPGDWQSVAVLDDCSPPQLTKIYLRLAGKAWWSFRGVIDHPPADAVEKAGKRRRSRVVIGESLPDLAIRSFNSQGRALARAMRAIRARIGATAQTTFAARSHHG